MKEYATAIGLLLAGLVFAGFGASALHQNSRARQWPEVQATIQAAGMNYIPQTPTFELRYTYEIEGRRYEGWSQDVADQSIDGQSIYQVGAPITVHVNPDKPSASQLQPAFHLSHLGWLLAGLVIAGAGGWMGWEQRRAG